MYECSLGELKSKKSLTYIEVEGGIVEVLEKSWNEVTVTCLPSGSSCTS